MALAFSPRSEALLIEALRIRQIYEANLLIIHVGPKSTEDEFRMSHLLEKVEADSQFTQVLWEEGDPARKILQVCENHSIDLLIAGALKKENLLKFYLGSIARRILRRAECSVLVFTDPSKYPKPFRRLVLHADDLNQDVGSLRAGLVLGGLNGATQIHIMKELNTMGMSMQMVGEEDESSASRRSLVQDEVFAVERMLDMLPTQGLNIQIKVNAGNSGQEVAKFCERIDADLLVMQAPDRKLNIFNRMFPNELEFIFGDLPTNLLIHHHNSDKA